jgi:hypothetical protein
MTLWILVALVLAVLAVAVLERMEFISVFRRRDLQQEERRRVSGS